MLLNHQRMKKDNKSCSNMFAIFLGGLSSKTTEEKIYNQFYKYGSIANVVMKLDINTGNNRGFAFVYFRSEEAAEEAVNEQQIIDGRNIDCELAIKKNVKDKKDR